MKINNAFNRLVVILVLLVLACLAFENPQQEAIILFEDDFQGGEPDNWNITAAWSIQRSDDEYTFYSRFDQEYIFEASGAGGAWVPDGGGWSNYAFRCSVRMGTGPLLLSFNLSEQGRYMVRADEYGLYLIKEYPAEEFSVIAQTGPLPEDGWHYLAMGSYDGRVQVYVDQELWIDYTDPDPLVGGTIAVASLEGSQVAVDNVLVTQLLKPLPSGEIKAPPVVQAAPPDFESGENDGLALEQVDEIEDDSGQGDEPQGEQGGQPDLVIQNASFDPDPVYSGQLFVANYAIANEGTAATGAFTLLWEFPDLGIGVCSWDYFGLAPGEAVWGGCQKVINADPGEFVTVLTVDFEGEIAESNEGNNLRHATLRVGATAQDESGEAEAALPDLMIGAMAYTDRNFRCDLVNYGQGTAPAGVRVTLYANGNKIDWQETATPMPSGASITFNIPVDLALDEINKARCIADRGNSIEEENDDNNTFVWVQE